MGAKNIRKVPLLFVLYQLIVLCDVYSKITLFIALFVFVYLQFYIGYGNILQ